MSNFESDLKFKINEFLQRYSNLKEAAKGLNINQTTIWKILNNKRINPITLKKLLTSFEIPEDDKSINNDVSDEIFIHLSQGCKDFLNSNLPHQLAARQYKTQLKTIKKLAEGKKVGFFALKKLKQLILAYRTGDLKINYEIPAVKRLKQAFQIYCEQGTLENTGKILQLTRERVRQLLVKGTKLGLFNYKGYDYPYVSKDEILNNYRNALNLRDSSTNLGISVSYLQKLIAAYGIKKSEFERIKIEEFKSRCVSEFQGLAQKLGKTPTSTDLQATNKGRYLYNRIFKLWGGIDEFRENIKIEKPPRMHFGERMRPWREKKQRLALIIRMQNLDSIRDFLKENGVQGISAISLGCNLKPPRTYQLLKLLTASGEIQKIGDKFDTVYKLKGRKIGGEDGNLN